MNDIAILKTNIKPDSIFPISNEDVSNFLNENNIQGSISSKIKIGLYYNDKLVFVSTFGKPRMDKDKNSYELYRSCSIINTSVIGGFWKMFEVFY